VANRCIDRPKLRCEALCCELHDTGVVIAVRLMILFGHQAAPLYLCVPPIRGSVGGNCNFPITCGTDMEEPCNQNLFKVGTQWYGSTCLALFNREPVSLVNLVFKAELGTLSVQKRSRTLRWQDTSLN
jgi:hypothetical protein